MSDSESELSDEQQSNVEESEEVDQNEQSEVEETEEESKSFKDLVNIKFKLNLSTCNSSTIQFSGIK